MGNTWLLRGAFQSLSLLSAGYHCILQRVYLPSHHLQRCHSPQPSVIEALCSPSTSCDLYTLWPSILSAFYSPS